MVDKIGFGLLGAGLVAPFHAKSIMDSEKCNLIAVVDVDKNRALKFGNDFNCEAYESLNDLIQDDKIQVINVVTPNHLHKDAVVQIARAGKHILVEKPPALSLRDLDEMVEICPSSFEEGIGVVLGV